MNTQVISNATLNHTFVSDLSSSGQFLELLCIDPVLLATKKMVENNFTNILS